MVFRGFCSHNSISRISMSHSKTCLAVLSLKFTKSLHLRRSRPVFFQTHLASSLACCNSHASNQFLLPHPWLPSWYLQLAAFPILSSVTFAYLVVERLCHSTFVCVISAPFFVHLTRTYVSLSSHQSRSQPYERPGVFDFLQLAD